MDTAYIFSLFITIIVFNLLLLKCSLNVSLSYLRLTLLPQLQGSDAVSTSRILVAVVKLCFEAKKWDILNENVVLLTKKRGQLKQVRNSW